MVDVGSDEGATVSGGKDVATMSTVASGSDEETSPGEDVTVVSEDEDVATTSTVALAPVVVEAGGVGVEMICDAQLTVSKNKTNPPINAAEVRIMLLLRLIMTAFFALISDLRGNELIWTVSIIPQLLSQGCIQVLGKVGFLMNMRWIPRRTPSETCP